MSTCDDCEEPWRTLWDGKVTDHATALRLHAREHEVEAEKWGRIQVNEDLASTVSDGVEERHRQSIIASLKRREEMHLCENLRARAELLELQVEAARVGRWTRLRDFCAAWARGSIAGAAISAGLLLVVGLTAAASRWAGEQVTAKAEAGAAERCLAGYKALADERDRWQSDALKLRARMLPQELKCPNVMVRTLDTGVAMWTSPMFPDAGGLYVPQGSMLTVYQAN